MNFKEVTKGISNYDEFWNQLIAYLKEYSVISFIEFKKYGKDYIINQNLNLYILIIFFSIYIKEKLKCFY